MVLAEQHALGRDAQRAHHQALDPEFVVEPGDHRLAEDSPGIGIRAERGHEDALELDQRLLVEDHIVEVGALDLRLPETEVDRALRVSEVMLLAREALFFGGGDQHAVAQQGGGGVVVETGNTQDIHQNMRRASSSA